MNETFILKKEHLKLLQRAQWYWEGAEFGGPAIDCKRPFGNSDVISDIIEILDIENDACHHCGERLSEKGRDKAEEIYKELLPAIRVILDTLNWTFHLGRYKKVSTGWVKTTDPEAT